MVDAQSHPTPDAVTPAGDAMLASVLRPLDAVNIFEETLDRLLRLIKFGVVPPGQRLPSERDLAARLGVSRQTVREAVRSLAQAGYLESRRGRTGGAFVLDWRSTHPWDAQSDAMQTDRRDELLDALDLRWVVEPGAAELAAARCTAADARRLEEALTHAQQAPLVTFPASERVGAPVGDGDPVVEPPVALAYRTADIRLHLLIAEIARSPSLIAAVAGLQLHLSDLLSATPQLEGALRHANEQHVVIVEAISRGDRATAGAAMRQHVETTATYLRAFLM